MEPADESFCRLIAVVRIAVEDRQEAALEGGGYGRALARVAEKNSRRASQLLNAMAVTGVGAPGR